MLFFVILFIITSSIIGAFLAYYVFDSFLFKYNFLQDFICLLITATIYGILFSLYMKIRNKHKK